VLLLLILLAGVPIAEGRDPAEGQAQASTADRLARVRADLFGAAARLDEDIRELTAILGTDPRSAEAHLLLAIAYRVQGRPEMVAEAKAELQQALDLNPDLLPARLMLSQIYFDLGRTEKARDELQAGLVRAPGHPQFVTLLGEVSRRLGDARRAAELQRQVLKGDPSAAQARYYLALALIDLKQRDEAIRELEQLARVMPVPDVLLTLGVAYLDAGRKEEAVAALTLGVKIAPTASDIRIELARACRLSGLLDQAERHLTAAAIPASARQPTAGYQKLEASLDAEWGALRLAQGRLEQAAASLEKALAMDPDSGPAHRDLAVVLLRQGQAARALPHAQRADKLGSPLPDEMRKALQAKIGKGGGW
jgi:tetratricopeptide (TPR) repeat protein